MAEQTENLENLLTPSEPQEQAEQVAPAQSPPQESSLPAGLLQRAQAAGLELDGIKDSESLANSILDAYMQARPYAEHGRSALAQRQEPQAASEPEAEEWDEEKFFSSAWTVPQLSPGAKWALSHGAFVENDFGMLVPKPELESHALPYVKEINDYQQARAKQNEEFSNNPVRFIIEKGMPYIERKLAARFQTETQQKFQDYEQNSFVDKFQEDNKSWLYEANGQLTQQGEKFRATVAELRESGITNPQTLAKYAMSLAGINAKPQEAVAGQQEAGGKEAAAPASQVRAKDPVTGKFVKQAEEPPKSKQESFIEQARKRAANSDSRGGFESNPDYQVANEGDLENMFSNAGRAAGLYA